MFYFADYLYASHPSQATEDFYIADGIRTAKFKSNKNFC